MSPESPLQRFWNMVKPPPAVHRPMSPQQAELKRRQRKLLINTAAAVAVLGAGAWVLNYLSNAPQRANRELQAGMNLMAPGSYRDAIPHFTRAISISPRLATAYLDRANAYNELGETDAALADYQASAKFDPRLADAHTGLAKIYLDRHDTAHALEELNQSIALQPTVEGYYQRGEIWQSRGEYRKAVDDYTLAIAERPDAPFIYLSRALAKSNLGDQDGAHADRLQAAQLDRH